MVDETAEAQKVAEAAARDYYQYGPDVRVTGIDGPDHVYGVRGQDRVDARIWDVHIEVPGKGTRILRVIHDGDKWFCLPTTQA